jgi:integrase/recombinase XerD
MSVKKLALKNPSYQYILDSFRDWLDVLGYADTTVYAIPNHIREFLHYLEAKNKLDIHQIDNKDFLQYYYQTKGRANQKRGGGLSGAYLNKYIQAIQLFSDYLRQSTKLIIPKLYISTEQNNSETRDILTQAEIKILYKATENYPATSRYQNEELYEALAKRDRASLTLLYGCGLRRNEAINVKIEDIQVEQERIYVRKGKNYRERIVPLNTSCMRYIQDYIHEARIYFLKGINNPYLLISLRGNRIDGQSLLLRIKLLQKRSENEALIDKQIGLHTLRHSIATHLLENGMSLEGIAKFLGHSSLESTQIYTHLMTEKTE